MNDVNTDRRGERIQTVVAILVLAVAVTLVMLPLLGVHSGYYPGGIDAMGFLAKIEKVALNWSEGNFSDWFPWWYNGSTITQYYPPLSTWIPAAIQMVTNDIFTTFKILCWVCLFTGGLATCALGRRLGLSGCSAMASGVLYATGTYTLYTVLGDGTIGRALSLPLFPMLLGALFELCEKRTTRVWVKTAVLVATLILVHAMHAYLIFICSGIAVLVYVSKWKDWLARICVLATACISGLLLTGFWSVPGYLQLDIPGVPAPGVGWEVLWATSIKTLVTSNAAGSYVLFGLGLLGMFASWKVNKYLCMALSVSAIITISLIYGASNPLYRVLPLNSSLAPMRFLNVAYLPCSLLAGFVVDLSIRKSLQRHVLPVVALIVVSLLSLREASWRKPVSNPEMYKSIRNSMMVFGQAQHPFEIGRIVSEATSLNSEQAYFALDRGFNLSNGWNIEGTPHAETYRQFNQCYGYGYEEYVMSQWALWNVRGVIIDNRSPRLVEMLEASGWYIAASNSGLQVLQSSEDSSYFQQYLSRVLVIGRSSFHLRKLIPSVTEGFDPNPLNYSADYLNLFDVLYLYDLPVIDQEDLERWLMFWAARGKRIVVDMSSMEASDLLSVGCSQQTVSGSFVLSATANSPIPSTTVSLSEGTAATYLGLDKVWMTTALNGHDVAVCGVRELQDNEVYFSGLHLPRLATIEGRQQAIEILTSLIGPQYCTGIEQGVPFDVEARWDNRGVSFEYATDRETPVVVSITHTARWHATIDGLEAPVYRNESLILLVLPSGRHSVRLTYGQSPAVYLGWSVSFSGILMSAVCLIALKRIERRVTTREVPAQ